MSALSRRKGAAWQAELARRWRDSGLFPGAYSSQGAQTRSGRRGAHTPPDVDGTPWWVEAKHSATTPMAALIQAETEADAANDERPCIAVVRPRGKGPAGAIVAMRTWTLAEMFGRVIDDRARMGLVTLELPTFEVLCAGCAGFRGYADSDAAARGMVRVVPDPVPPALEALGAACGHSAEETAAIMHGPEAAE